MRRQNQRFKSFLVYKYLFEKSDENHCLSATNIIGYLKEHYGMTAEERSIYRDIYDLNVLLYRFDFPDEEMDTIWEEIEEFEEDGDNSWKAIVYDGSRKGYYVRHRKYDLDDLRTIATCIYSAKFITERQAKQYVNMMLDTLVCEHQAAEIRQDAFLVDRGKTINKNVFYNIQTISAAMRTATGKDKLNMTDEKSASKKSKK